MIPSINPPTDNLYKFISLFGLTIFLFSIYHVGIVYDKSSESKIEIEDLKTEIQQTLCHKDLEIKSILDSMPTEESFKASKINMLDKDLSEIKEIVSRSSLAMEQKIQLNGKINKLVVRIDKQALKFWSYIIVLLSGLITMTFGFIRWYKRDQVIRDKILSIEHEIKKREKVFFDERHHS